jgi:MYXO-CTERM domain-containing protein
VPNPIAVDKDAHPYSTIDFNKDSSQWSTVSRDKVLRGDAMVYNTNGAGHIFIYESGDGWGTMWAYECKGCSYGCVHNTRTATSSYHAIRRVSVTDGPPPPVDAGTGGSGGSGGGTVKPDAGKGGTAGGGTGGGGTGGAGAGTGGAGASGAGGGGDGGSAGETAGSGPGGWPDPAGQRDATSDAPPATVASTGWDAPQDTAGCACRAGAAGRATGLAWLLAAAVPLLRRRRVCRR